MTARQRRVLDFVRAAIERTGVAPTIGEIADGLGFKGRAGIHEAVGRLVDDGRLTRIPHRSRGLALPGLPNLVSVPSAYLRAELARRGDQA